MADKPKSILVYSKQAPKLGYRLVTPLQQPLPTITKTPILPIMGGVNINVPNQVMPSQQRTPINLPMADRLINVPSPVAPVKDKSGNKKPLEWGFKGRKKTDIDDIDYHDLEKLMSLDDRVRMRNKEKLIKGSKKNKKIIRRMLLENNPNNLTYDSYFLEGVNMSFKQLEKMGVPRELTGKIYGNPLGTKYLFRIESSRLNDFETEDEKLQDWKTGWLRYYNELNESMKETFDSLSDEWFGSPSQLVNQVKDLYR